MLKLVCDTNQLNILTNVGVGGDGRANSRICLQIRLQRMYANLLLSIKIVLVRAQVTYLAQVTICP